MELVISHRQLKHGVMITVKGPNREEVLAGQIVGFPYSSGPHGRSANGTPDVVLVRTKSNKEEVKRLEDLGLGPKAKLERRTYVIDN